MNKIYLPKFIFMDGNWAPLVWVPLVETINSWLMIMGLTVISISDQVTFKCELAVSGPNISKN